MAVYERNYKRYDGATTPTSTRFLVLPRYIFKDVFQSRWLLIFYVLCFVFPLICAVFIYLTHNAEFLKAIPNFQMPDFLQIDNGFFKRFLSIQGTLVFALTVFIGPGLVSRDLANNGLSLYLSRPFSRVEYVLGKLSVLAILLSALTWVAGLLLMLLHANFVGLSWFGDNFGLAVGFFVGSWLWILALGFLALAASAWVKWRAVAGFAMLAVVLGGAFFGSVMINNLFDEHQQVQHVAEVRIEEVIDHHRAKKGAA
ncbi:MAG: ABC transporter permease subunit, partial [Acidobacteriota bacterium]